ncbi:MAG: M48 family metallopeptidase [Proteobacteria bacterium]|nr:M48 family metallopeptidase [Pseudomonadota bacterium]
MDASVPGGDPLAPRFRDDTLYVNGSAVAVRWRLDRRARRVRLSVDPREGSVIVTLPLRTARRRGEEFLLQHAGWVAGRIEALPPRVPFRHGASLPVLGRETVICHAPGARRGVWCEAGEIRVSGAGEHLARRVTDWLKRQALAEIGPKAHAMAASLGRKVRRVSVREMRSRWGSCSVKGDLAFCWRLMLAPGWVLDYVIAHEVAHLAHMNHGPRFWRTVQGLVGDIDRPRAWLRRHGNALHRYG